MTGQKEEFIEKDLTEVVIGGFYTVYNALGYGFSEGLCERAIARTSSQGIEGGARSAGRNNFIWVNLSRFIAWT